MLNESEIYSIMKKDCTLNIKFSQILTGDRLGATRATHSKMMDTNELATGTLCTL